MNIMLGNLSLEQIEDRCGVTFPEPFRSTFKDKRQEHATIDKKGVWHGFDIPFVIVCGGEDLFNQVKDNLLPLADKFKKPLGITYKELT